MKTPEVVILRDALRLADAEASIEIWEKIKAGIIIFPNSEYDPNERIAYYTAKRDKYLKRVENHGASIAIGLLDELLPAWAITIIKKIFGELV